MKKKLCMLVLALWLALTAGAWFGPVREMSLTERRPLAQFPQVTGEKLLSGRFMSEFGDFTLDQFPLRDTFRSLKALFHRYALGQKDNNGIYITQGHAVKQEYPLDRGSLDHALSRFNAIYEKYLTEDNRVVFSLIPDKGCYLAQSAGQPHLDLDAMADYLRRGMPWAAYADVTGALGVDSYYRTDTHWRQEKLLDVAGILCDALGVTPPREADFTLTEVENPFYGVYYGQAALPMAPDRICLLENSGLSECTVYDFESGKTGPVYDLPRLEGKDPYEVYLSGPRSLLTVENPNAATDRELIVFRDSFGSSLVPLLIGEYRKVTLVDIRYIQFQTLDRFLEFQGRDILFLYSTLVLNNSETIK